MTDRNVEREANIVGFCLEHDVDWEWRGRRGRAKHARPRKGEAAVVHLPPIKGQMTYFVALHELGHVLSPTNRYMRRLDAEVDAWKWALANSDEEPSRATWRGIYGRLKSYISWALRNANVAEPSDESREFIRMVAEMAA